MMREWYSGSTSPCQGEDRGFDPRLALILFAEVPVMELPFFISGDDIRYFGLKDTD